MSKAISAFSALLLALALHTAAGAAEVIRLSEPVAVTEAAEIFGSLADANTEATALETLL